MSGFSELYKKYNISGPRYTSYPTVPYWMTTPTEAQWLQSLTNAIDEGRSKGIGASFYVHIPFCENLCTYCGCNTRISKNHKIAEPYIATILEELDLYVSRLNRKILLSDLYLGGGTPTFLSPDQLKVLIEGILARVELTQSPEFSLEADPRVTHSEHLKVLFQLGFRNLSLGVQDFDPAVQNVVHRIQSEEQVRDLTELARSIGFTSINYDLIYGLPLQTLDSVQSTLQKVQKLRPDRVAFYGYAHVPWIKPSQKRFTESDLPSMEMRRSLYQLGRGMLENAGYREIGMDHYALQSNSLWNALKQGTLHRNFMGYSPMLSLPLIGLGVSAIGDSSNVFIQNEKLVETYQARVKKGEIPILRGHVLTREDQVLRHHISNLMTRSFTEWNYDSLKVPFLDTVFDRLVEMQNDGLVQVTDHSCKVTEEGRPFIRNICMAFDAQLYARSN